MNGRVTFVTGTKFGGVINRNPKPIPFSQILNHVTPAELQRYEHQDYLLEELREATIVPPKPRGRPRKSPLPSDVLLQKPSVPVTPNLRGRKLAVVIPVSSPTPRPVRARTPVDATPPSIAIRVPSTTKPLLKAVTTALSREMIDPVSSSREESPASDASSVEAIYVTPGAASRPQYSMVAASGLAPSETSIDPSVPSEASSRAESHDPLSLPEGPPVKRRKLTAEHTAHRRDTFSQPQLTKGFDGAAAETDSQAYESAQESQSHDDINHVDTISTAATEAERQAIVRQFQTNATHRAYPPAQCTVDTARQIHQAANVGRQVTGVDQGNLHKVNSAATDHSHPALKRSLQTSTPPRKMQRRTSTTPHFPRAADPIIKATTLGSQAYIARSPKKKRGRPSTKRVSTNAQIGSAQLLKSTHSPQPNSGAKISANPVPIRTSNSTANPVVAIRSRGIWNHEPTADMTMYFRPKNPTPKKPAPPPQPQSGSESEDPLARSSSPDNLEEKVIIVQPPRVQSRGRPIQRIDPLLRGPAKGTLRKEIPDSEGERGRANAKDVETSETGSEASEEGLVVKEQRVVR